MLELFRVMSMMTDLGVVAGGRQGGVGEGLMAIPDHGGSLDVADALTLS